MRSLSLQHRCVEDLARAVKRRFDDVAEAVDALVEASAADAGGVHKLRVAARRALAALALCKGAGIVRDIRGTRRRLRPIRRAAGAVRDCDIHCEVLRGLQGRTGEPAGVAEAIAAIENERAGAVDELLALLRTYSPGDARRDGRRVRQALRDAPMSPERPPESTETDEALEAAAAAELSDPDRLHDLRLCIKSLRYRREIEAGGDRAARARIEQSLLAKAQARLGEVNDIATLVARLRALAAAPDAPVAIVSLRDKFETVLASRCVAAAGWWRETLAARPPGQSLPGFLSRPVTDPAETPLPIAQNQVGGTVLPPGTVNGKVEITRETRQSNLWTAGMRAAVIDVGSNSIRFLAAEMIDDRSWRVLAEERAMTRLVHGLAREGRLATDAMARSVEAVARFAALAERFGAGPARAFATAAVREARNGRDFVSLVAERTGLSLEVISAGEEGRLTFRSVARAHDLSQGTAAVVDMGGGSMEVVFSDGGVITRNRSMPLGALRVTEQFGGAEACSGKSFRAMRRYIQRTISRRVPRPDTPPSVMAGCGGTFTTILTLAAAARGLLVDRGSPELLTLGPVSREQIRSLIRRLRGMTLEERLRVPGLPSDRSDIVIAGLVGVERLMKHLGCSQVVIHPGGVREGLLLRVVEERLASNFRGVECTDARIVSEARDLAQRCRYPKAHSEHVALLAGTVFDQCVDAHEGHAPGTQSAGILPGLGSLPHERALLIAAAILHDVGTLVEYRRHHRHSARIIRHEGIPSCMSRQVELIAQIARYHRRASPDERHPRFAALTPEEQGLVRRLAAILRLADGLDRPHSQTVHEVRVSLGEGHARIEIEGAGDLRAEMGGALRKITLLERTLGVPVAVMMRSIRRESHRGVDEPQM